MHQLRSVRHINVHMVGKRVDAENVAVSASVSTTYNEVRVNSVVEQMRVNTTNNEVIVKSVGDLPYANTTKTR